jgi:hypothetical protein
VDIELVRKLLLTINDRATPGFAGLGIIVSDSPSDLPITSLRLKSQLFPPLPTVEGLLEISEHTSEYHDGFHVLSSDLQLQLISQYFSPPIVALTFPQRDQLVGGRYVAALFGSTLAAVVATGVVSTNYGVVLFVGGKEVFFAPPKHSGSTK